MAAGERSNDLIWVVPDEKSGIRLDVFITQHLSQYSRSQLHKLIQPAAILIDGEPAAKISERLKAGSVVEVTDNALINPTSNLKSLTPSPMDLQILYEDDDVLVLNKTAGVVVHPGAGTKDATLIEGVLYHMGLRDFEAVKSHFSDLEDCGTMVRPGVVHRLDKDTSGVMVFAKNVAAHRHLAKQFAQKTNLRRYIAVLIGRLEPKEQTIDTWHQRDPLDRKKFKVSPVTSLEADQDTMTKGAKKRRARTKLTCLRTYAGCYSLVEAELSTGRTHQIRLHAAYLGCPVLGDEVYGHTVQFSSRSGLPAEFLAPQVQYMLLHARTLGFVHPRNGERLKFDCDLPDYFRGFLEKLRPYADT